MTSRKKTLTVVVGLSLSMGISTTLSHVAEAEALSSIFDINDLFHDYEELVKPCNNVNVFYKERLKKPSAFCKKHLIRKFKNNKIC